MREGSSDTGRIERDLDDTRSRLDATIGALQHKLAPKEMVDQAMTYFSEGGGVEFRNNLGRSVRDNPVPVALIGIGVGWLMLSSSSSSGKRAQRHESDFADDGQYRRFRPAAGYDDPYRRYSGMSSPGLNEAAGGTDVSAHQPMPYEAAAYDDLAFKAEEAGRRVEREHGESEDTFQDRIHAARGTVLGLTRNAGEAASSFKDRVESALAAAAERVRSMASSAGSSASGLVGRGQAGARDLYGYGRSTAASVRDGAGDVWDNLGDRPLLLGALGVTVGAVIGMLVPATRYERRLAGSVRSSLHDTVRDAASEAGQRVARVAESVLDTAHDAARREGFTGTPDAPGLAASARERVGDVAGRARHVVEETAAAGREAVQRELAGNGGGKKPEQGGSAPQQNLASATADKPGDHGERRTGA